MDRDSGVHLLGEVRIDGRRRVSGQPGDALGNLAPEGLCGADHRNRPCVSFDDDFGASLHSSQDDQHILSELSLANV